MPRGDLRSRPRPHSPNRKSYSRAPGGRRRALEYGQAERRSPWQGPLRRSSSGPPRGGSIPERACWSGCFGHRFLRCSGLFQELAQLDDEGLGPGVAELVTQCDGQFVGRGIEFVQRPADRP